MSSGEGVPCTGEFVSVWASVSDKLELTHIISSTRMHIMKWLNSKSDIASLSEKHFLTRRLHVSSWFLREVLSKIDIVDVIRPYVKLKKRNKKNLPWIKQWEYYGICPFHNEKSASFTVTQSKKFYHCHGCWAHWNAATFLKEHLGLSYTRIVTRLVKMAKVRMEFSSDYYAEDYWKKLDDEKRWCVEFDETYTESGDVRYTRKPYQAIVDRLLELSDDDLHANFFGRSFEEVSQLGLDHVSNVPDDFEKVKSEYSERTSMLLLYQLNFDYDNIKDYKPFQENLTAKAFEALPNEPEDAYFDSAEVPSNIDEIDSKIIDEIYEEDFLGMSSNEPDMEWSEDEQEDVKEEARLTTERLLAEEMERFKKELLLQNNLALLEVDIAAHEQEDHLIQNWLDTRVINIVSEDDKELVPGDAGKIVCVFNKVTKEFSLVFGKNKCRSLPAKLGDLGKYFANDAWKTTVWLHKDIKLWDNKKDMLYAGGWSYIVLGNNKILIAEKSGDYFEMSERVVRLGLLKSGYELVSVPNVSKFSERFISSFYNEEW